MFIQTEPAADGAAMTFLPGRTVLGEGTARFEDSGAAARSPLAAALFAVAGVREIVLGADFITIGKAADADWQILKPPLLGIIMEHFIADRPVTTAPDLAPADEDYGEDAETVAAIRDVIESHIGPGLAAEGGEVSFQGYADYVVRLGLRGTSFAQPLFAVKVKIENTLRNYVPEIEAVEFIHEPGQNAAGRAVGAGGEGLDTPEGMAIQTLLDERINPAIAAHGGYIGLDSVRENRAYVRFEGGCQGCGMADVTLKQGVMAEIMREVPSIEEVIDATDHSAGVNPYYQPAH